ncbi:MFS general substrate transporter [Astrocystis sublimbata]|nr:MFS general substrate transporter [Astrocystis sublimbata]
MDQSTPSSPRMSQGQHQHQHRETSPLLPPSSRSRPQESSPHHDDDDQKPPATQTAHAIIFKICLIVAVAATADSLIESPQLRIFESIICYRYYEAADPSKLLLGRHELGPGALGGVAEKWCKVNSVQTDVALLRGYQQTLDGIPALLLGVPFGLAADRFGRKPILTLGLVSLLLRDAWVQLVTWLWQQFDIRVVWLSTLHGLLGGGSIVLVGFLFVAINDVTSVEDRASVFMRAGAASLLPNLLIPPLAARLMMWDPWIPCLLGILARIVCCVSMIPMPETLKSRSSDSHQGSQEHTRSPSPSAESLQIKAPTLSARLFHATKRAVIGLRANVRIIFLVALFAGHSMLGSTFSILLQYSSKRYNVNLSTATLLITVYNAVRVAMLLLIMPLLVVAIKKWFRLSEQQKDLYTCRAGFVLVLVGWSLIALSPNIPLFSISLVIAAAGTAPVYLILRSFLSSLILEEHTARVYSATSTMDTLGSMFGGALVANLFDRGMEIEWIGLPFLFLGLIGLLSALVMFLNKPTHIGTGSDEEERSSRDGST